MYDAVPHLQAWPVRRLPADLHMPEHVDGQSHLSLLLSGQVQEQAGGQAVAVGAGSVVVKPADVAHCTRLGPEGAHMLRLSWVAPAGQTDRCVLEHWRWHAPGPLSVRLLRLWLSLRQPAATADHAQDLWLDLCVGLEPDSARRRAPPTTLARVLDQLRADPGVRVGALAATARMHPVSLARMFRRHLGRSIADQRRILRVLHALQALVADDAALVEAAAAGGYADQAHFTRECRQLLGTPPARCRPLLQATALAAGSVRGPR